MMKSSSWAALWVVSFLSFVADVGAGSPRFPTELDYGKLSPEEQSEFESAAFLMNLRSLGVLEPNGVICAQPGQDKNGKPTYNFSVQDKAFETGSCQLNASQAGLSQKLKNLAQATMTYQAAVHGSQEKLPISVTGFADGQSFSAISAQSKAICGDLANAKMENGSYNRPLAQSRARGIAGELASVLGGMQPTIAGYDSPAIVGTNLKNCPTRRQVVITFGSSPAVNASQAAGDYEPASEVDGSVQLGLNAAVSVQILRAHAKVQAKNGKSANELKCPKKDRDLCVWNHMQSMMDELGFDKNDVACRATTMALADQILGRALNSGEVGKQMIQLAQSDDASWAKKFIIDFSASKGKTRRDLSACNSSAALHLTMPTSDMLAGCERERVFDEEGSVLVTAGMQGTFARIAVLERQKKSPSVVKYPERIQEIDKELVGLQETVNKYPGVKTMDDFKAYRSAGNASIGRRNLSHNCVTPDTGVLAAGFEASPKNQDYFISPELLGSGKVRAGYTDKTFGSIFHSQSGRKGFGCSACGSGIIQDAKGLHLQNGVVENREGSVFGADGMNLVKGTTTKGRVTAASFMAPTLYEIPDCANCSCVTSMKDALDKAFASGGRKIASSADGVVKRGDGKELNTADLKNSCLFAPPVAHACPVGPNGEGEQQKKGAELERTLTYINKALDGKTVAAASGSLTHDFRSVLSAIESCGKPGAQAVKTVEYYQNLVDEVVCDTKPNPIVLPENKGNEKAECALAEKLLAASKQSSLVK